MSNGRTNYTPHEWRRVGIEREGDTYRLTQLVSRVDFTATDLRLARVSQSTQLTGLTLGQARMTGAVLEAAMQKLHAAK